ncbi:C-type lectin domain family 5 member A-like [Lacerta agilis]|uniref:C-type lectin domain family 5 member A-like n=1 Tax=Lacerta agilis TaxID=80427 RepID=UPI001419146E|nr:C-type lectin domain family 5 member A-like [Lacerta agilis]
MYSMARAERSNERKHEETGRDIKSVLPAHSSPPCPHLWFWYEGICYFFSDEEKSWMSSQEFCLSFNASLAVIPNNEKVRGVTGDVFWNWVRNIASQGSNIYLFWYLKDIVKRWTGENSYWIGLRRDPDQPWKWTNGENSMCVLFLFLLLLLLLPWPGCLSGVFNRGATSHFAT